VTVKYFFSICFLVIGIFFILLTLISAYLFLVSFLERQSHGSGPLFADVELFALAVIILGVFGTIAIIISRKISKSDNRDKKESTN